MKRIEKMLKEAKNAHDKDDLDRAETLFLGVLDQESRCFDALFALGSIYLTKEKYSLSKDYLHKALEVNPESPQSYFNLGLLKNHINNNEGAAEDFNHALKIDPEYSLAHFALANTLYHLESFESAEKHYERAINLETDFIPDALYFRALCLNRIGEPVKALICLNLLYELITNSEAENHLFFEGLELPDVKQERGKTLVYLNEYEKAEKDFNDVLDIYPERQEIRIFQMTMAVMNKDKQREEKLRREIIEHAAQPYSWFKITLFSCPRYSYPILSKELRDDERKSDPEPKYWSDGYALSLPEPQYLIFCPLCGKYHHVDELKFLTGMPAVPYNESVPFLDYIDKLEKVDYLKALIMNWPAKWEREIRTSLLWRQNDPIREKANDLPLNKEERFENLERLSELIDNELDPFFAGEIYREMGDFARCMKLMSPLIKGSDEKAKQATQIYKAAKEKNIYPLPFFKQDSELEKREEEEEIPFEERRNFGYDPFPDAFDFFAFPQGKEKEFNPFLAINLSLEDEELNDWVVFTYETDSFLIRHNRLFTEGEWEKFQTLDSQWQNELIWFWSRRSWELTLTEEDCDRHYLIKAQLAQGIDYMTPPPWAHPDREIYNNYIDFIAALEEQKEEYAFFWNDLMANRNQWDSNLMEFLNREEKYYYYLIVLDIFYYSYTLVSEKYFKEKLSEDYSYHTLREESRGRAMDGLKYLDWSPNWFQGHDQTPCQEGEKMEFICQIWSDYIDPGGSKLLYLFYDRKRCIQSETYDYD